MEKSKFLKAKKQYDVIECCNEVLKQHELDKTFEDKNVSVYALENLLEVDKQVFRSFIRWVENEKAIAEQKLKEI